MSVRSPAWLSPGADITGTSIAKPGNLDDTTARVQRVVGDPQSVGPLVSETWGSHCSRLGLGALGDRPGDRRGRVDGHVVGDDERQSVEVVGMRVGDEGRRQGLAERGGAGGEGLGVGDEQGGIDENDGLVGLEQIGVDEDAGLCGPVGVDRKLTHGLTVRSTQPGRPEGTSKCPNRRSDRWPW